MGDEWSTVTTLTDFNAAARKKSVMIESHEPVAGLDRWSRTQVLDAWLRSTTPYPTLFLQSSPQPLLQPQNLPKLINISLVTPKKGKKEKNGPEK